ncbi:MAG TPA: hypothetical protein VJ692_02375 [Nitrospiraceae bacterium]|nr:hypothetical protein [Nitrospiraceae bacterium]
MRTPSARPVRISVRVFPLLAAAIVFLTGAFVHAEPIAVQSVEGATHGFLLLRSEHGDNLAHGELIQTVHDAEIESRLVFSFKDGSVHDERVRFSQQRVFTMLTYQLTQRGPSFPHAIDVSLNRKTGEYRVRSRSESEDVLTGRLDLPSDVSNGLAVTLIRNIPPGESRTVRFVAFTPEPKLIDLMILPAGEETVMIGDQPRSAIRYTIQPKLNAIIRFFGKLLGKLPTDFHYHFWILPGEVPAFVRFEGPLSLMGPVWQIELISPRLSVQGESRSRRR